MVLYLQLPFSSSCVVSKLVHIYFTHTHNTLAHKHRQRHTHTHTHTRTRTRTRTRTSTRSHTDDGHMLPCTFIFAVSWTPPPPPYSSSTLQIALLEKYFPLATDLHRLVQYCLTVSWVSVYWTVYCVCLYSYILDYGVSYNTNWDFGITCLSLEFTVPSPSAVLIPHCLPLFLLPYRSMLRNDLLWNKSWRRHFSDLSSRTVTDMFLSSSLQYNTNVYRYI